MIERVCVIGAGTIGSLFAGHLAQVAEVQVLTRRHEHAAALNEQGLRVVGRSQLESRVSATSEADELGGFELGIIACKGTDLEDVASALEGRFADATLMTVQNGLGAEAVVRTRGAWPLISAITFMSGSRHSDTEVRYVLDTPTWLGPYETTSMVVVEAVAALIVSSGLKADSFEDLRPAQWSKLIFNATVNGVAAVTGLPHDVHFAEESRPDDLGVLVRGLMDEGKAVARALGVALHDDPWEMNRLATQRGSAHYPSMLEDVRAHRPTEAAWINGALIRAADEAAVEVPLQRAIYALVRAKEASYS